MGFREVVNKNQPIVLGVVVVIVLIAGYVLYSQMGSSNVSSATSAYYTVDDGATYFSDDIKKIPPFDYGGKPAVRCYVFKCGSEKFVAYMERYTPEYKAQVEKMTELSKSGATGPASGAEIGKLQAMAMSGHEIKKPGAKDWSKAFGPKMAEIGMVRCKDGSNAEAVLP